MPGSTLETIYAAVPHFECRPGCHDCCGPIGMSPAEFSRIEAAAGPVEHKEIAGAVLLTPRPGTLDCRLLLHDRCSVYAARPLICRLYGAAEGLQCPHGCRPEKLLSDAEAGRLLRVLPRCGGESLHPDTF